MTPTPGLDSISTKVGCVRSHRPERRPFGLTSLETGGWRCPMGRRWRLASGRRKVVKWRRCWPAPQGACEAGGAPAPGSGATTPLPEAGVRKHPAPEGALRLSGLAAAHDSLLCQKAPSTRRCIKTSGASRSRSGRVDVRKHPAPEGALRRAPR